MDKRKRMRICHGVTELAGQMLNACLGLESRGHEVGIVEWTSNRLTDTKLKSLGIDWKKKHCYPLYAWRLLKSFLQSLWRYDIFHFHFKQSLLPLNLDLPILAAFGKTMYFEYHGGDLREGADPSLLHEGHRDYWMVPAGRKAKRLAIQFMYCHGIILHDHELLSFLPKGHPPVKMLPLRLQLETFLTNEIPSTPKASDEEIVLVHAPSHRAIKGTETVIAVAKKLAKRYPIRLCLVENLTHDEAMRHYREADIIIDQLCVGAYGVFAVEGMALGKPVITYITEEMRAKYPASLPLVSANEAQLELVLEDLLQRPEDWQALGEAGRAYAKRFHDYRRNAALLEEIYLDGPCAWDFHPDE